MLEFFPTEAKRILDVGCGCGAFAENLRSENNEVWGIELMEQEAEIASKKLYKVFSGKVEDTVSHLPDNYFEVIYCNDVLEHLAYPYQVLEELKRKMVKGGVIISSIPNMRHHKVLKKLLFNKTWKYTDSGIMDFTHLRFFTSKSICEMFRDAGFEVIEHKGINRSKSLMPYLYNIPLLFTARDIFYYQFATVAKNI